MSTFRLAVRLARRELRRRPWRTALVLLMVVVPTAAMTTVATIVRTGERPPERRLAAEVGQADLTAAVVAPDTQRAPDTQTSASTPGPVAATVPPVQPVLPIDAYGDVADAEVATLRAALPAGSTVVVERRAEDRWRDGARRAYFTLSDVDVESPVVEGRFGSIRGRAPANGSEAVVDEDVARELDLSIGERFRPERLGRTLTVVGTVRTMAWPEDLVITPGPLPEQRRGSVVWVDLPGRPFLEGARGVPPVDLTSVEGWSLSPAVPQASWSKDDEVFWTYVGGTVALAVVGTVIAAAFAVAARRQLRTLGLLSSAGASPRTLRWFLVTQGATTGVVGSLAGVAIGLGVALALPDGVLRSLAGRHADGLVVRVGDVLPIVVIGALAAAVAAWLPARSIATVPTLAALAGRRPLGAVPARLPVFGGLAIGAGCALFAMSVAGTRVGGSTMWALVAIAGGLACLFGALAVCPWVVAALEGLAGRWPQSWRLAARSIARNRVRSSAVVGAVVAVSASLVAGTTLFASFRDSPEDRVPWVARNQVRIESIAFVRTVPSPVVDRVRALVPQLKPIEIEEVGTLRPGGGFDPAPVSVDGQGAPAAFFEPLPMAIARPELLELFDVPADRRAALDRGQAVAVAGSESRSAAVFVALDGGAARPTVRIPLAEPFRSPQAARSLPRILLSERTARDLGLTWQRSPVVNLVAPEPLTRAERRVLRQLGQDVAWEQDLVLGGGQPVQVVPPDDPDWLSPAMVRVVSLGSAFALVALVVAIGLALAAKDSEDERQVLTAVGAPPKGLRRVAALRAALLVAAAAVVAVPAGLLPAAAIVEAATSERTLRVDGVALLFVAVAAPLLVAAVVSSVGAVRDRLRPRRPASFVFAE